MFESVAFSAAEGYQTHFMNKPVGTHDIIPGLYWVVWLVVLTQAHRKKMNCYVNHFIWFSNLL